MDEQDRPPIGGTGDVHVDINPAAAGDGPRVDAFARVGRVAHPHAPVQRSNASAFTFADTSVRIDSACQMPE